MKSRVLIGVFSLMAWGYVHLLIGLGGAFMALGLLIALKAGLVYTLWALFNFIFGIVLLCTMMLARMNIKFNGEVFRRSSLGMTMLILCMVSAFGTLPLSGGFALGTILALAIGAYVVWFYTPPGFRNIYTE